MAQPAMTFQPFPRKRMGIAQSATGTSPAFSLPENYGFNDLAGYEEGRRNALGQNFQNQIGQLKSGIQSQYDTALKNFQDTTASRRASLSSTLSDNAQKTFQLNNPSLLEDLNSRGLLSSPTAVANSEAQAMKQLEVGNQSKLLDFDTNANQNADALTKERLNALTGLDESGVSANIQSQQDALDAGLDLRRGKLEGDMANANANREDQLARDLAGKQSRNQLLNSLIGAGGTIGGGYLTAKLLSGGSKAASALPMLGGTTSGTLGGATALGGAGTPASSLFPGGLGAVGTPTAGAPTAAGGIGLGGAAAIGGAGIASALASRAAQNKVAQMTGSNAAGSSAGVLANPIGAQLNSAKSLVTNPKQALSNVSKSLGFGAGKTANGNDIADASRTVQGVQQQLTDLKSSVARGEISQQDYIAQAQPMVEQMAQLVGGVAGRGKTYANAINKVWQDFQNAGLARNTGNGFVAV